MFIQICCCIFLPPTYLSICKCKIQCVSLFYCLFKIYYWSSHITTHTFFFLRRERLHFLCVSLGEYGQLYLVCSYQNFILTLFQHSADPDPCLELVRNFECTDGIIGIYLKKKDNNNNI